MWSASLSNAHSSVPGILSSVQHSAVCGSRAGRFAYDALYSFASGDTKLSVAAKEVPSPCLNTQNDNHQHHHCTHRLSCT